MMNQANQLNWKIFFAFAAVYIIWGSTYLAILIGLNNLPPFLLSALRFLIAGILLCCWCWWKGEPKPDLSAVKINSICGILMLVGGTVSVVWAEQFVSSGIAAMVVTALPFWFVLLDKKQWSFYFSNKSIIAGLALGFTGVTILIKFGHSSGSNAIAGNELKGMLVILAGGLAFTIGSLYSKYKPTKSSLLANAAVQFLAAGIFCLALSTIAGEWRHFSFSNIGRSSLLALLYLIFMGSLVAYIAYLYLIKSMPPAQVSTYVYVNPVVAVILGVLMANESLSLVKVITLLIILAGVLLVNLPKYRLRAG